MPSQDMISLSERETLIRATPLFRNLNVHETSQLAAMMKEVDYLAGEIVVKEDDLIKSVYIIATGTLEVTKQINIEGASGTTFLAILNPGENIGLTESGIFAKTGRRTATVKAQTPALLLKIDIKDIDAFLEEHPETLQSIKATTDSMLRMQFIKESNPFAHLSNQRIAWLANSVKTIDVNAGEILFTEGDTVNNCYMILEGKVEISALDKNGNSNIISTLHKGQLFGEQALFKSAKRTSTAQAVIASQLLVLDQDTLEELKSDESTEETTNTLYSQTAEYNQPKRLENIIHHRRLLDDGEIITTLKNPQHNAYLQLNEEDWFIWQQLNGQLTIKEVTQKFAEQYKRFDPQKVTMTINRIVNAGFAKLDVTMPDASVQSAKKTLETKKLYERLEWIYALKNADYKISLFYQYFGFIFFYLPVRIAIYISIIAGIILYPQTLEATFQAVHKLNHLYIMILWAIFLSATFRLVSPIAKAFTLKYFKHSVPSIAIGIRLFLPVAFVDTSDLWDSSRFQRCMTMSSGIFATLFIASLLTFWTYFEADSVFALTASLCALILYFLVLRSLNPLLDLDGYLTLENALDAQRLRESVFAGFSQQKTVATSKTSQNRKRTNIFFTYYFIYVLLNFAFIFVLQYQLRSFGLMLWTNGLIYVLWLLGLFIEFISEVNYQRKVQQILAAE